MLKIYNVHSGQPEFFWRWLWINCHYRYLRELKGYVWKALQTEGGGFDTPKLRKSRAILYVATAGGRIKGIDELNKIIFYAPKS